MQCLRESKQPYPRMSALLSDLDSSLLTMAMMPQDSTFMSTDCEASNLLHQIVIAWMLYKGRTIESLQLLRCLQPRLSHEELLRLTRQIICSDSQAKAQKALYECISRLISFILNKWHCNEPSELETTLRNSYLWSLQQRYMVMQATEGTESIDMTATAAAVTEKDIRRRAIWREAREHALRRPGILSSLDDQSMQAYMSNEDELDEEERERNGLDEEYDDYEDGMGDDGIGHGMGEDGIEDEVEEDYEQEDEDDDEEDDEAPTTTDTSERPSTFALFSRGLMSGRLLGRTSRNVTNDRTAAEERQAESTDSAWTSLGRNASSQPILLSDQLAFPRTRIPLPIVRASQLQEPISTGSNSSSSERDTRNGQTLRQTVINFRRLREGMATDDSNSRTGRTQQMPDEQSIEIVMEMLSVERTEAIDVLQQYNNVLASVIASIYG